MSEWTDRIGAEMRRIDAETHEMQARDLKIQRAKQDRELAELESRPAERLVRLPEILQRTGLSKQTIYRLEGDGRFPGRRKLGLRAVGWAESAVNAWISDPANWRGARPS
jgi:prophage regulatory protein